MEIMIEIKIDYFKYIAQLKIAPCWARLVWMGFMAYQPL